MRTTTASAARVQANQQNAQRSTGPRTPEGKAVSSQNGTKHGLACSDDTLARQQPVGFQSLVDKYAKLYTPQNQVMHDLLHQLASARLRQNRAAQLEDLALQSEPNLDQLALLTKLERYRKSAEASYHRALKQLQTLHNQYAAAAEAARKQAIDLERRRQAIAYGERLDRQSQQRYASRPSAVPTATPAAPSAKSQSAGQNQA